LVTVTNPAPAFRLTTLRKVSSILDRQPAPVALKCSITSGLRRSDTSFLVGALFGPHPLSDRGGEIGEDFRERLGLGEIRLRQFGIMTSRKSFRLWPAFF
jgi:hypothetical protein